MEYISKVATLDTIREIVGDDAFGGPRIQQAIEKMPNCHTVNITRCSNCKYAKDWWVSAPETFLFCTFWSVGVPADGFCYEGRQ